MHTIFALLCFVVVIQWLISPYPPGLLRWHCGNLTIAPVLAKQPWWIWINTSCEFIMNDCITTTKQSTTKPCAYFLGYTVRPIWERILSIMIQKAWLSYHDMDCCWDYFNVCTLLRMIFFTCVIKSTWVHYIFSRFLLYSTSLAVIKLSYILYAIYLSLQTCLLPIEGPINSALSSLIVAKISDCILCVSMFCGN